MQTRLGTRVRELRTRRDWTQEKLGEQAELSYKFIGEVERGVGNPTIGSIARIARALGIDVAELFTPEVTYPSFSASDLAAMREAHASLSSVQDIIKRVGGSVRPPARKRRRR